MPADGKRRPLSLLRTSRPEANFRCLGTSPPVALQILAAG
jgi:hypothetical protein